MLTVSLIITFLLHVLLSHLLQETMQIPDYALTVMNAHLEWQLTFRAAVNAANHSAASTCISVV